MNEGYEISQIPTPGMGESFQSSFQKCQFTGHLSSVFFKEHLGRKDGFNTKRTKLKQSILLYIQLYVIQLSKTFWINTQITSKNCELFQA